MKQVRANVILRYPKRPFVGRVVSILILRETYRKSDKIAVRSDSTVAVTENEVKP